MTEDLAKRWDRWYEAEPPPWDIGEPQPVLVELDERGLLSGRVVDVGCGTGEHALLAAAAGATVLGIDVSPRAIELARAKAQARGVAARFAVADALNLVAVGEMFDVAIDSGLFHAFEDHERVRYAVSLAEIMRDGGHALPHLPKPKFPL